MTSEEYKRLYDSVQEFETSLSSIRNKTVAQEARCEYLAAKAAWVSTHGESLLRRALIANAKDQTVILRRRLEEALEELAELEAAK